MHIKHLNHDEIIREINSIGYSVVRGLIDPLQASRYIDLLDTSKNANGNCITSGSTGTGTHFLSNGIACSDELLNLIASEEIISLSKHYLASQPYLKCHRVYKTIGKIPNFAWHTDNKDKNSARDSSKGIICILYLNNIKKGGLEVIPKGFHDEKLSKPNPEYIKNLISKNGTYKFVGLSGDAIFFDQSLIHRAAQELFAKTAYSLWFQITNDQAKREQLLLTNHQIPKQGDMRYDFLNIGIKTEDTAQPKTKEKQISPIYALKLLILSMIYTLELRSRAILRPLKKFRSKKH